MAYPGQHDHMHQPAYNDHILTITERSCADPYVIWDKGLYYMTFTVGDRIEIWAAESLFEFEKKCRKETVWRPPPDKPYSGDLWAPELHNIQGRWYVYFAADDPKHGNKSHRMFVITGPEADKSPMESSSWSFHGQLEGMPADQWAIDGTVISLHGGLCFVYSGWPLGSRDEAKQEIYIVEMVSPTQCQGHPVRISTPDNPWEYSGQSGINEGPQFLCSPDGRTHEYKMNVLHFTGGHPLSPASWQKSNRPLIQAARDDTPPYGPGHGNFVSVNGPGGTEVWSVFHATDGKTGWGGRKARIMRVGWGPQGPFMSNGYCGRACSDVNHFLHGCDGGACGGKGHCWAQGGLVDAGPGGGGGEDLKREAKELLGKGKKIFGKVFK
ncbi:hypothetical protein N0V90_005036 [Kalmusia sp. IMI 367209]|nr:hypothetical protein N0V90_005036 [Kalmusia sp. IMI 367209]